MQPCRVRTIAPIQCLVMHRAEPNLCDSLLHFPFPRRSLIAEDYGIATAMDGVGRRVLWKQLITPTEFRIVITKRKKAELWFLVLSIVVP